jgi:hypothetical protein
MKPPESIYSIPYQTILNTHDQDVDISRYHTLLSKRYSLSITVKSLVYTNKQVESSNQG